MAENEYTPHEGPTGKAREDLSLEELRAWMRQWIADATKQPLENITDDKSLDEFGLGSRDAVSMASDIEDFTGVQLTATVAFQHPTIALLSQRIIDGDPVVSDDDLAAEAAQYDRGEEFEANRGTHDVAVVGLATRFPKAGETPESTWEFLIGNGDATTDLPEDRWLEFKQDPRLKAVLDEANTFGGYLDDVASFDAEFFQMTPREVEMVDPQQRLALELTWEALEQANIPASSVKGTRTGVWMGSSANDYQMLAVADPTKANPYALTGTSTSIVANRVSYFYDFHGPSVAIDTACSSSLVAIHQAVRSLRDGETDMAVAGGVNMLIVPAATLGFDSLGAQAPDGKIKAFSSDANGMIRAEGGGVVLLKRLADAERDGDDILGVIAGSAVTSDGKSNGIFAPNPEAQVINLRDAYIDAGIDPRTVDYLEAHGTGTILGDPLEADAIGRVLGRGREAEKPLLLGSAKTNFGHLEAAAGIAGVAKVLLAIRNGRIPASLNFAGPNPYIQFEANRLLMATRNTEWPKYSGAKLAGVTGNGFGGTNAHVVVKEYVAPEIVEGETESDDAAANAVPDFHPATVEGAAIPLVLTAYVPSRRRAAAAELLEWLESDEAKEYTLVEIGRTLASRNHGRVRSVVMAKDLDEAIKGFRAIAEGKNAPNVISANQPDASGPAFIFSGFGSHHRKMAKQLYLEDAVFKHYFDEVNELIIDESGNDYADMITDDEQTFHIETGQVGIFAIQVALVGLFRHYGIEPGVVLPHSMGEATSAWVTGGLSLEDAVRVICQRSRLMGEGEEMLPEEMERFMALVEYSAADIETVLGDYEGLEICVYAAPTHTVLGGPGKVIDKIVAETEAKGLMARKLVTRGASHTSQMDPLLGELQAELMGIEPHALKYPMYSTVNKDEFYKAGHAPVHEVDYWIKGLRHSVWFTQAVEKAVEAGYRTFIEFSPNPITLISVAAVTFGSGIQDAALVQTLKRKEDEPGTIMTALATVFARGHHVDVAALFGPGRYAPVPRTKFQRKRIWIQTKLPDGGSGMVPGGHVALPDGRHVWQLDAGALTLGDQTRIPLVDLAKHAAVQVLDGAAVTAAVEHGEVREGLTLTTTLTPHPGGASIQVHENTGKRFRLLLDAVVVGGEASGTAAAPLITKAAAPAVEEMDELDESEPEITVSEETEAPAPEGSGERWSPDSGETVEHRLGLIIAEIMGFEIEDLPKEIPLIDLGMDSLIAMRIKNRTEYEFDIPPIQIQAVRDASFNDVVQFVEYAVEHRDQVDALAEHQSGTGELADAGQLAEMMKAAKAEAAAKAETAAAAPAESPAEPAAEEPVAAPSEEKADTPDLLDGAAIAEAVGDGVPPRDAAERLTFATYAIVVGKSPGGVFNELDVLAEEVAEKLTARLSERAGGEIDIEDVIDSKNIEEMATYVGAVMNEATPVDGFVRTLRKPENTDRTPLFLFHPAGGNTTAYEALLRKLPEDLPIYGFERVEGDIEERVAAYLPKLKEIQPEGPYRLAGWSLGGAFAYGLARALEDEGQEVEYIGLLDVVAPKVPLTDEPAEKKARLERWEKFARKNYDIGDEIELPMDRLNAADDEGQFKIIMELVQLSDKKIPTSMIEHQRTSFVDNRMLIKVNPADYGRFGGTVTLYRADRMHDGAVELEPNFADIAPDGGWAPVVEDLRIVKIGGDHLQLIDEPYIGKIAVHMTDELNRADGGR